MKLWNIVEIKPRKLIAGELQMPKVVHDGVDTSKTTVTADETAARLNVRLQLKRGIILPPEPHKH